MSNLDHIIRNVEKDNAYTVIEVLKESSFEVTEKVRDQNGKVYVRKYFLDDESFSVHKLFAISSLTHPNLPITHDCYELSDRSVIIQEFVEGRRLSQIIDEKGAIEPNMSVEITRQLCNGVEHLHKQNPNPLIHRDIKPDNIIITPDGALKLIDFGAVREYKQEQNQDTMYVGTPGYASPEQFGFGQTDIRADIYAIGMTLRHMLTGKVPKRGENWDYENITSHIPDELMRIIRRATEFDPKERYGAVDSMRTDLIVSVDSKNAKPRISDVYSGKSGSEYNYKDKRNDQYNRSNHDGNAKKRGRIYPFHNNLSRGKKIALMPFHVMMIAFFVLGPIIHILQPTEFGFKDNVLVVLGDIVVVAFAYCYYAMGFNLFDMNNKWRIFSKHRVGRKIVIGVVVLLLAGFLLEYIQSFHSAAFTAANLANS